MKTRSRRYVKNEALVDRNKRYEVSEAVTILKKFDAPKFNETVDVCIYLGIDTKRQNLRGAMSLPHGIGKEKKVIAFVEGEKAADAEKAGAEAVGGQDLVKRVLDGWTDFDVAVATPGMMKFVGRLGKVLGPQNKMPSPKSGTVTEQIGEAVREFRAGKIEFRTDKGGNIHAPIGKRDFAHDKLAGNVTAFIDYVQALRPPSTKGNFILGATLAATMSPGIQLVIR